MHAVPCTAVVPCTPRCLSSGLYIGMMPRSESSCVLPRVVPRYLGSFPVSGCWRVPRCPVLLKHRHLPRTCAQAWQFWFLPLRGGLPPAGNGRPRHWLRAFSEKLLAGDTRALGALATLHAFSEAHPPLAVEARLYRYHFSEPAASDAGLLSTWLGWGRKAPKAAAACNGTQAASASIREAVSCGAWWRRRLLGVFMPRMLGGGAVVGTSARAQRQLTEAAKRAEGASLAVASGRSDGPGAHAEL